MARRKRIAWMVIGMLFLQFPAWADFDDSSDIAIMVLKCYHPTGKYLRYEDGGEWSSAAGLGATASKLYRIHYQGALTGHDYRLTVAILGRNLNGQKQIRAEIVSDTAIIPANRECPLTNWVSQ